jgi:hypothetical glycosyl hydrolase
MTNWLVSLEGFTTDHLGKTETIMAIGNGYLGSRAANEEKYLGETRNTFIAGVFNRLDDSEVTELANIPDVFELSFEFNGKKFDLSNGIIHRCVKSIDLKNGEVTRDIIWEIDNQQFQLELKRFISLKHIHLSVQTIKIKPLNQDTLINITSGIDCSVTNSGVQHFTRLEKRLFDNEVLHIQQQTTQSKIQLIVQTSHRFMIDGISSEQFGHVSANRRKIDLEFSIELKQDSVLQIDKMSYFVTNQDIDIEDKTIEDITQSTIKALHNAHEMGYQKLLAENTKIWEEQVWNEAAITIEADDNFDQLAIRFAQYHLRIMTPYHDHRVSIPAKGLTGEGYKGHVFWDTEIFMLPYYIYQHPAIARNLLQYRFETLSGARKKAKENGYRGAMFPWESALKNDGEVTPIWGAVDIITGESIKIWSGFIEQHITSDIAYAVLQYYKISKDEEFMLNYGYEIIFDTAVFWVSRLEFDKKDNLYHINNVVGPDEYKEHIDDNAFTNHMAHFNISSAIHCFHKLNKKNETRFIKLKKYLNLDEEIIKWEEKVSKIYLPKENEFGIVPQDKTYLGKTIINLDPYKNQKHVGSIFKKYNLEQINEIQVSKQADIMILFYLLEERFSLETKLKCWEYYEPKTLNDSSLSLSTHSILANDLGYHQLAYDLFLKAAQIDLGQNMKSSDEGIHAASLGGVWQCIVNGFGGVRLVNNCLRISPSLPKSWRSLSFKLNYEGATIHVYINHEHLKLTKASDGQSISINIMNTEYQLINDLDISLQK